MKKSGLITLTTDFGTRDNYVGSLRGVIHAINPKVTIADISHDIPSYDIVHGAYVLGTTYALFPKGTIHVAVVDPGVGSERLPILIETERYCFIGPDNGLFSMVQEKIRHIYQLKNARFFRPQVSNTFHGRDVFSPVAAHLSRGVDPKHFGPVLKKCHSLEIFKVVHSKTEIRAHIVAIDKFGNAITSLTQETFVQKIGKRPFQLTAGNLRLSQLSQTYSEVGEQEPVLVFGSNGLLELALYQGSIAERWKLKVGQEVRLKKSFDNPNKSC